MSDRHPMTSLARMAITLALAYVVAIASAIAYLWWPR